MYDLLKKVQLKNSAFMRHPEIVNMYVKLFVVTQITCVGSNSSRVGKTISEFIYEIGISLLLY